MKSRAEKCQPMAMRRLAAPVCLPNSHDLPSVLASASVVILKVTPLELIEELSTREIVGFSPERLDPKFRKIS